MTADHYSNHGAMIHGVRHTYYSILKIL
eukprot:SAG11_NODE_25689_length_355_cov_1.003906_1_plen_27_part_01